MIEEVRLYSTVAGELVKLVQTETPKCFVEYEQYLALEESHRSLLEAYEELQLEFALNCTEEDIYDK